MNKLILILLLAVAGTAAAQPGHPQDPQTPARKACTDAMNEDPLFAKEILNTVDKQIDQKTIDAHLDANMHIQKNERHVIYAYAAMWIIAALFVAFLWKRQQALQSEIAQLRKDLDAAAKGGT